ncbi:RecQ family ATP-dependent DNA helicase [Pontibacillus salicampi]|uniref:RecQ family ATP-dependent DNA helicase n=1 Tax=Pontibacillus salicampi TaxID=1449801 RepID=A0ABV6LL29_9BACI
MINVPLEDNLKKYFGFDSFREGQKEIIEDVLKGEDVIGILPTGTGKSLCYQYPAAVMDGTVLIVSPLISLMVDQVKQLKQQGFKRVAAINSFLDRSQKKKVYDHLESYQLIYCSPEMLQNEIFIHELKQRVTISLFVVDEAHCISQWGHEFRTDYLKLHEAITALDNPTLLALSATAPFHVQEDISQQLGRPHMKKRIYPMDRENIAFTIEHVANMDEKLNRIQSVLTTHPVPTMIYFSSRQWSEKAAFTLSQALPHLRIAYYHGGMEQMDRLLIQQQFMNDQLDVICCTSAFGMGVNKSNIRLVIHAHLPSQVESFLQEIGRAGRDGEQSVSLTFYAPGDSEIPKTFIRSELPEDRTVFQVIQSLHRMALHESEIMPSDVEMEGKLEISEVQWRFLRFQLEKHGMIQENRIVVNEEKMKHSYDSIISFIQERTLVKEKKLQSLLHWLHQHDCLRKEIYSSFQSSLKEPTGFCCDRCDFTFSAWDINSLMKAHRPTDWITELRMIFRQGDDYEME